MSKSAIYSTKGNLLIIDVPHPTQCGDEAFNVNIYVWLSNVLRERTSHEWLIARSHLKGLWVRFGFHFNTLKGGTQDH